MGNGLGRRTGGDAEGELVAEEFVIREACYARGAGVAIIGN